ncbi:hypothetical protein DRP04_06135 [Archaeoglobales archaeon]|nr:MAG: hypothetical protein DRP04_06135 [Archaeoglobales archaeon]
MEATIEVSAMRKGIELAPWEIEIEERDGMLRIEVPEAKVEKVGDRVILVVPKEKLASSIETSPSGASEVSKERLRDCAEDVATTFWFMMKAREARQKGDEEKAKTLLIAAAATANSARTTCKVDAFKKLSDVLSRTELEEFEKEVDKFMEEDLLGIGEILPRSERKD